MLSIERKYDNIIGILFKNEKVKNMLINNSPNIYKELVFKQKIRNFS
jgi:hypothetical protein